MSAKPLIKQAPGIHALEELCADLFASEATPAPCVVLRKAELPEQPRENFGVVLEGGAAVGVAVPSQRSRLQRSETLVKAARNLARREKAGSGRWITVDHKQSSPGDEVYELKLFSNASAPQRVAMRIHPEALTQLSSYKTDTKSRGRYLPVEMTLVLLMKEVRQAAHDTQELQVGVNQWCLGVLHPSGEGVRAEFTSNERKGVCMSEEKLFAAEFPVQVELGTLSLSSDALLELRPGDEITVPDSIPMLGFLRVGKEPWARVRIEQRDNALVLKVEELLGIEETFPEKSRLIP
jgi:hypothetical protein